MRRYLAALTSFMAALVLASGGLLGTSGMRPAAAQSTASGVQAESNARVEFGSEIRFQLRARGDEEIRAVLFLYQVDDSTVQNTAVPSYQPGTSITATYGWRVATVLAPGAEVRYQWQLELASGKTTTTAEQSVTYNDTRFNWREAQGDQLTVFFTSGDTQTGQALLDEASRVQRRLRSEFGLTLDKPLRIFAYTREQDYVSALAAGRPQDFAMSVGADRIFVLAPGGTSGLTNSLKSLRREIANTLFVQKTRNPYAEPPRWLAEGFAFFMSGEELTADVYRALGQYAQANRLLPLKTLGGNFPNNERDRQLAAVESLSVVKFMVDSYGPEKLKAVLAAFKEGSTVDAALKKGLGVTLDQLEGRWKAALKSGAAAKPSSGQRGSPRGATQTGGGGFLDRAFGPAIGFWEGVFGAYTRPVLLGVVAFIGLGLVAVVGSIFVAAWRRGRAADD